MTSAGPYTQSFDFKHMYDFVDLRTTKCCDDCTYKKNTLMGVIGDNSDFTIFTDIIEKARYVGQLSQLQSDYTIFVPSDYELRKRYSKEFIDNIDDGLAREILAFSMMNRKIDQSLLQSSPYSIFPTIDRSNSIRVCTINGVTKLPNYTTVIHWNHPADNGIVHVVDNFLIPYKI